MSYPDGTGPNDKRAPWNQKDRPEFEPADTENQPDMCENCAEVDIINDHGICKKCFESWVQDADDE